MEFLRPDKNKSAGFTLVETLVVVFIVGLLSTILIVNWRQNEKQYQLQMTAQEIVQNIRKTQGMALNGSKYNGDIPQNYSLYFQVASRSYNIFFEGSNDRLYNRGVDYCMEDFDIETELEINSISGIKGPNNYTPCNASISFSLPDGFTTIKCEGVGPALDSVTITIRRIGATCPGKSCKNIVIMKTGQINIQ